LGLDGNRIVDLDTAPQALAFFKEALVAGVFVVQVVGGFAFKLNQQGHAVGVVHRPALRLGRKRDSHFDNAGNARQISLACLSGLLGILRCAAFAEPEINRVIKVRSHGRVSFALSRIQPSVLKVAALVKATGARRRRNQG